MIRFCLLFLFLHSTISATETMPWFGNFREFEFRAEYTFQSYDEVNAGSSVIEKNSNDHFLNLSLAISPYTRWSVQAEVQIADFEERSPEMDSAMITCRYLFLNDILGDPVSVATGVSVSIPFSSNSTFLSSRYHSNLNFKVHVAVGKELVFRDMWSWRFWALAAIGRANKGDLWGELEAGVAKNIKERHRFRLFGRAARGFGKKDITALKDFPGYRSIDYRYLEAGLRYTFVFEFLGSFYLEALRTFYSKNFPKDVLQISCGALFPFAL